MTIRKFRGRALKVGLPAVLVGSAAAVLVALTVPSANAAATTLRGAAEAKNLYFGAAISTSHTSDSQYTSLAGAQFDMATPENEMKWDTVESSQGNFNFGPGDQIVSFATANNMRVRGHNLVWHSQLPGWVTSLPTNQVQAAMENHITKEATHYAGKVYAWDVVNEPFDDSGNLRTDVFDQAMGSGYIADALKTARAADPNAKLYLNDYNIEGTGAKSDAMYNLVSSLKQQGAPIDGVGFESHLILGQVPSTMQANMARFAALGVDVAITELDIRMNTPSTAATLAQQATDYQTVVNDCLAVSRCVGITTWGVTDKYSWVPGTFSGQGAALLYDENYNAKPAYNSVLAALGGSSSGSPSATSSPTRTTSPSVSPSATRTTSPSATTTTGSAACKVTYAVASQWNNGFTASVTIANTGTAAISSWTLKFTWPGSQSISQGWSANWTQSGTQVTATSMSWNGALAPGQSTQIGFNGNWSGSNPNPTAFTLNGSTCTTG
jgi:endo-1,4-beta-xylanase